MASYHHHHHPTSHHHPTYHILFCFTILLACFINQANSQIIPGGSSSPSPSSPSPSPNPSPSSAPSPNPTDPTDNPSPSQASPSPAPTNSPSVSPTPSTPSPNPSPSNLPSPTSSASNNQPSPVSTSPNRGASPSPSPSPSPASSLSQSQASSIVIVTITRTAADGSVYTSLTSTLTPLPRPSSNPSGGSSSGSSSNTWAIIGGIVGGLACLGAVVFIVFRCTQRRFSDLDDEDVAIKWPELVTRTDDPSTLNPLAARPGVGHGVGEDDEGDSEKPGLYSHGIAMEPIRTEQRHPGMYDSYSTYHPAPLHSQDPKGYSDDPYLGPSGVQQPYLPSMNNLGYDDTTYQQLQQHLYQTPHQQYPPPGARDLQSQPSVNSAISRGHDSNSSPERQANRMSTLDPSQYPISWDGPEDIPLTVVNQSPHSHQNPPHPYHPS